MSETEIYQVTDKQLSTIYSASTLVLSARNDGVLTWDEFTAWLDMTWGYLVTDKGQGLLGRVWDASEPDA